MASGSFGITFPSDWASPTNTYTSSGTWSKGSLADDDYVWIYLLGSGGGGGSGGTSATSGGDGGTAQLLYGTAGALNGGAYVVGAAAAGRTAGGTDTKTSANVSTFTLTAGNGGTVFSTVVTSDVTSIRVTATSGGSADAISLASFDDFTVRGNMNQGTFADGGLPTGVAYRYYALGKTYNDAVTAVQHCIFGGGNGGAFQTSLKSPGTSEFSGAGGASAAAGANGSAPGGGGGGSSNGSNVGGTGAAGNVRVYHV